MTIRVTIKNEETNNNHLLVVNVLMPDDGGDKLHYRKHISAQETQEFHVWDGQFLLVQQTTSYQGIENEQD